MGRFIHREIFSQLKEHQTIFHHQNPDLQNTESRKCQNNTKLTIIYAAELINITANYFNTNFNIVIFAYSFGQKQPQSFAWHRRGLRTAKSSIVKPWQLIPTYIRPLRTHNNHLLPRNHIKPHVYRLPPWRIFNSIFQ